MFKIFKTNRGKFKDFYLSVIAGLFSGLGIGIFFRLTTDIVFNRWINLFSYELFAAIIYVLFVLFILGILYTLGMLIVIFILKDKKRTLSFHLNFIAVYSSAITFLLILYYNISLIRNVIALVGFILFFVLAYFTVKRRWPEN